MQPASPTVAQVSPIKNWEGRAQAAQDWELLANSEVEIS